MIAPNASARKRQLSSAFPTDAFRPTPSVSLLFRSGVNTTVSTVSLTVKDRNDITRREPARQDDQTDIDAAQENVALTPSDDTGPNASVRLFARHWSNEP